MFGYADVGGLGTVGSTYVGTMDARAGEVGGAKDGICWSMGGEVAEWDLVYDELALRKKGETSGYGLEWLGGVVAVVGERWRLGVEVPSHHVLEGTGGG
ncbi:hypothetical protein MMC17_009195 [Xylographa soralifera]|nr:hypothetical protein [Xylographa soralifera]